MWVVDPIDGTRAFVKGDTGFCVSIAQIDQGRPVAGVVYNPNFDELLHARVDGGAFLNDRPIRVTQATTLACRMVGQPEVFARRDAAARWPGIELITPMPNAMAWRLCLVAAGRWDAAVALNPEVDWDLAAAVLVREAGGIATDREGKQLVFNQASVLQRGVVAAGAPLYPLIMEGLQNHLATEFKMTSSTPDKQLLHLVIGGELKSIGAFEFANLDEIHFVGAFPSYNAALLAWKGAAHARSTTRRCAISSCTPTGCSDPETGKHHNA